MSPQFLQKNLLNTNNLAENFLNAAIRGENLGKQSIYLSPDEQKF